MLLLQCVEHIKVVSQALPSLSSQVFTLSLSFSSAGQTGVCPDWHSSSSDMTAVHLAIWNGYVNQLLPYVKFIILKKILVE